MSQPQRPRRDSREPGLIGRVAGAVTGRMVEVVPAEAILDNVDLDALLDRIDPNRLLDRVDVNRLLDRVDVDRLLAQVDVDALLAGVDLDTLLSDVQIEALVRRAGIPALVAEATGTIAGNTLDSLRRQLVGIDTLMARVVDRLLRRGPVEVGPESLVRGT